MTGTVLTKDWVFNLEEYFTDAEGDLLQYTLKAEEGDWLEIVLDGSVLSVKPLKPKETTLNILVSDGEEVITGTIAFHVIPLWRVYWWLAVPVALVLALLLWRAWLKPKARTQTVEKIKSNNQFSGRLDLYFTRLPEEAPDIPPLTFRLYKVSGSKICLSGLLKDYSEEAAKLELNQVYLIAGEERKMMIVHACSATVMLGTSIVCRQVPCYMSFGDVLYITSADGTYDLELRYISVIQ